jgi:hypothetical protein
MAFKFGSKKAMRRGKSLLPQLFDKAIKHTSGVPRFGNYKAYKRGKQIW